MTPQAFVLTYHAIERGEPPLCIEPALFRAHLDALASSGVRVVTLDEVARELGEGGAGTPAVAITFDDGFASVAERAAPLLAERGLPATVFCVAGHLGARNGWPSQPASVPRLRLAGPEALREVAAAGFEVGSHGLHHEPLASAGDALLRREILDSRDLLEQSVGVPVRWFAYPYGLASRRGRALAEHAYDGACGGGNRPARAGAPRFLLPRVDAHYLRPPARLRSAVEGAGGYLALRRAGARLRRIVRSDFARAASRFDHG